MRVELKCKKVVKGDSVYYILEHWYVFDNGKKYKYHTEWLKDYEYNKLKSVYGE